MRARSGASLASTVSTGAGSPPCASAKRETVCTASATDPPHAEREIGAREGEIRRVEIDRCSRIRRGRPCVSATSSGCRRSRATASAASVNSITLGFGAGGVAAMGVARAYPTWAHASGRRTDAAFAIPMSVGGARMRRVMVLPADASPPKRKPLFRHPFRRKTLKPRTGVMYIAGAAALLAARPEAALFLPGLAMIAIGQSLRVWATGYLLKTDELTTAGPYAHLRHPLYVGSLLMGCGFALVAGKMVAMVVIPIGLVFYFGYYLRYKERVESERLEAIYGDAFRAYRTAVPDDLPAHHAVAPAFADGDPAVAARSRHRERRADRARLHGARARHLPRDLVVRSA